MAKKSDAELVSNRRAFHDYEILETWEAGLALLGTEIKSLRAHGGNLQDAYIIIADKTPILKNASITPYRFGNIHNHEEKRERTLLLHKREIIKLKSILQERGLTVIPLALYLKNGVAKIKIASARGKKSYDKRSSLKEKDAKLDIARAYKEKQ